MIPVGRINNPHAAQVFCDYLSSQKIVADWLPEGGMCLIRVQGAQRVDEARVALQQFLHNPNDPRFHQASWSHGQARAVHPTTASASWWPSLLARTGPLTVGLVVLSSVISLFSAFGDNEGVTYYLWFHLPSILHGQLHRLITPIFLHLSVIHLLFNMMWLWDLGGALEKRLGKIALLSLLAFVGVVSNLTQYLVSGPFFGGMSGVVYGLLGYLWLRGRRDPTFGVHLAPGTMVMMLIWLVLCFTGLMGPVANAAHLSGLLLGLALAFVASQPLRS
jgi:GlpG protein